MSNRIAAKGRKVATKRPNGVVLYEGPSRINPTISIVVIATGLARKSANSKTGNMVQTWILVRDVNPFDALAKGLDSGICGGCQHRPKERNEETGTYGQRTCYVDLRGVLTVWKAYHRGIYPTVPTSKVPELFEGRTVRLGSYGDPAAVPLAIWQTAISRAESHTGYTHQWQSARLRDVTSLCQASVDTIAQAEKAKSLGLGYFRVKAPTDAAQSGEIVCPASKEAGKVTTCAECRMCDGSGKTIVIDVHGIGATHFAPKPSRQLPVA